VDEVDRGRLPADRGDVRATTARARSSGDHAPRVLWPEPNGARGTHSDPGGCGTAPGEPPGERPARAPAVARRRIRGGPYTGLAQSQCRFDRDFRRAGSRSRDSRIAARISARPRPVSTPGTSSGDPGAVTGRNMNYVPSRRRIRTSPALRASSRREARRWRASEYVYTFIPVPR
jgi:hypothetical protein